MHLRENLPHFLNSCRFLPGTFSCAIDCFLEIWFHCVSRVMPGGTPSHILRMLNAVNLFVNSLPTWDPHKFHIAREDVWAQLRIKCPSLVPMDCSAQFSEIFQLSVFDA